MAEEKQVVEKAAATKVVTAPPPPAFEFVKNLNPDEPVTLPGGKTVVFYRGVQADGTLTSFGKYRTDDASEAAKIREVAARRPSLYIFERVRNK